MQASPRGLYMASTAIVQFHPVFITKGDRAYRMRCFYAEQALQPALASLTVACAPS